ncbi:cytochrome P450 3A56 [Folsomia candida]|uniref:cytochrome P450 3A56 n=1 Tax=Folsomia candida TaxID=158441 RepID=UPI000B907C5E|nr:cytochrome P450 3A56 [Folsomia candida]
MFFTWLIFILALFGVIAFGLIIFARWNYGKLDNLGFPIIPPSGIRGSIPNIHHKVQHYEDIKRFEENGPIWGLYQGRTPIIFIADPDLIKSIFVKDSSHFFDREPFNFGNPILNQILDYLPGDKWKTMRVSQTKLFSSGKIKQYSNSIFKKSMEDFLARMDQDLDSSPDGRVTIDARERFCTFTVDAIARSMLSMKVEPDGNEFYTACKRLIGDGQTVSPFYVWTLVFPFLTMFEPSMILDNVMVQTFRNLLTERKRTGFKFDDFGDIMNDLMGTVGSDRFKKLDISETTIFGQAVNLFLAGFDRISTIMTFLVYHLSQNLDAQERLHQEIDLIVDGKFNGEINHDTLADMPYLNACISEASRLYPTFIRPERHCNKEWECPERGIKIPKGITVQIASWAVNRNPNIYDSPHDFIPERFLPENKGNLNPYAFSSFGFGHRNCIGIRFAYEAMKVSICHMLHKYRFELRTDSRINFKPGIILIIQYDPVYLDVVKRNKN